MGLFGKIFEKKECAICGGEIGLLGNRKLEDGNMCKNCASLLSPWLTDRRHQTVEEIKEHLAYREENKKKVEEFSTTRVIGQGMKIYMDEDRGWWLLTRNMKFKDGNPDILEFSQVTGCTIDIDETKCEIYREKEDGEQVSYNPPRYEYSYDFYLIIHVNSPWFSEMRFQVNNDCIESRTSLEYREAESIAKEMKEALTKVREDIRESIAQANAPKQSVTCPYCSATTTPDENGRCEYCGGAVNA